MNKFKPVAVFLGPSLGKDHARALLDADYYPPARKGDVYRILTTGVETIVLIDGVFHSTPTIWQRELLYAIRQGIRVIGASSMGALRAAELHTFGMIGRGTVFEWYRDGKITGDDEVALLHGLAETDFQPLSEPLVNIRHTLQAAVAGRRIVSREAKKLAAGAKQLFYPERSHGRLLRSPAVKGWSRDKIAQLEHFFLTRKSDIKKADAIDALRFAARTAHYGTSRKRRKSFAEETWSQRERLLSTGFAGTELVVGAQVLAEARKDHALFERLRATLSRRRFLLEWASQNVVTVPVKFKKDFATCWSKKHRVKRERAWLPANGLTAETYSELLAARALLAWMTWKGPPHFGLELGFISEWARQNGVRWQNKGQPRRLSVKQTEDWIVRRGPIYFGLTWNLEVAFLQELQLTGKAAGIVASLRRQ